MGKNPAYTIKGNVKYVDLSLLFSKGMGPPIDTTYFATSSNYIR
jgi:hypothetical protein